MKRCILFITLVGLVATVFGQAVNKSSLADSSQTRPKQPVNATTDNVGIPWQSDSVTLLPDSQSTLKRGIYGGSGNATSSGTLHQLFVDSLFRPAFLHDSVATVISKPSASTIGGRHGPGMGKK